VEALEGVLEDGAERLKSELAELAARIRRQVSHLEALEADTDAGVEIRSRLRELAALGVSPRRVNELCRRSTPRERRAWSHGQPAPGEPSADAGPDRG
jgi:hypothetical protein